MAYSNNNHSRGQTQKMYHYTDAQGLEAIERTGAIMPSNHGRYGQGTYFTNIPPTADKRAISQNNWNNGCDKKVSQGKADYAVEVDIPRERLDTRNSQRDVVKHDGPVYLDEHRWRTHAVDDYQYQGNSSRSGNQQRSSHSRSGYGRNNSYQYY